ncbi:MAG: deoxyribonuclease IV [Sulfurospirillum sp.]|nr:deoxyribonuclease IV [Sulfurospirillum sp.]MBP9613288.1 deoxyribonuclease IV [Sulfurospirillum sp.]
MKFIGAHVSASGGVFNAPINATKIGAKAFALFTKNQRQWDGKALTQEDIARFKEELAKAEILPKHVLPHDSYLINLGHPDVEQRAKSLNAFIDEVRRCELLGLDKLNFHPGSHLKQFSEEECLHTISDSMNEVLRQTQNVTLVVENTAGQGSNLGYKMEHLSFLMENSIDKERVGVCIDTCHLFTSGYDIRDEQSYKQTFEKFDTIVGFKYLKGMHLNDSKPDLGKRVDRHDSLGRGKLGLEPFRLMMNDARFNDIPLVLETIDDSLWAQEIALLYSLEK